jgi:hypothetical protein
MLVVWNVAVVAAGLSAGMFLGLAMLVREVSAHKIAMRLLDRGDTPPPRPRIGLTPFCRDHAVRMTRDP